MKKLWLSLWLLILSSCNTFSLTAGKPNEITDHTALLNAINALRQSSTTKCIPVGGAVADATAQPSQAVYTWNANLEKSALSHANYLEQHNINISVGDPHNGAGDSSVGARVQAAGFTGLVYGENIGGGQLSVKQLLDQFQASNNGHCQNLMDADFTTIGAALVTDTDNAPVGNYWVLNFGKN
jgi:uncharacterized protein YkwD